MADDFKMLFVVYFLISFTAELTFCRILDYVNIYYYSDYAKHKIDKIVVFVDFCILFFVCSRIASFRTIKIKTHN
jgi:hypothetical protein